MLSSNRKIHSLAAISAALICLLIYLRALSCGFINLDDPVYITGNSSIRQLDLNLLQSVFTRPYYFGWLPLTYLSFALDYHFWGLDPFGYHLTNILLHAANAGLVVLIAAQLLQGRWTLSEKGRYYYPAVLLAAGLLWGLHPLRVESVAWVSQRKDVLNGFFALSSALLYLRYAEATGSGSTLGAPAVRRYLLSLLLFICSLLAKQVSVVLPVMLLVLDWYPLGRLQRSSLFRILLEKFPFFIVSGLISLTTIYFASQGNAMITAEDFPYYARALVSGNALFEYCRLMLYPVGIQPYFVIGDEIRTVFIVKSVLVLLVTAAVILYAKKKPCYAAVWALFLLPLLPVLAFTQTADDTAFASRYTYLPAVAPAIALVMLCVTGYQALSRAKQEFARIVLSSLALAVVIGYGAMTVHLISAWQDPGTLWTRQILIQPLGRAYTWRGTHYLSVGRYAAAVEDFTQSISVARDSGREDLFNLYAYRGESFRRLGRFQEAVDDLTRAIELSPQPHYHYFRGLAYKALGMKTAAEEDLHRAGTETGPIRWYPYRVKDEQ